MFFLSLRVVSSERPIYFFGYELDKATPSLLVAAQQTQTLAHGGGAIQSIRLYL